MVYVPFGWHHTILNLELSCAIGAISATFSHFSATLVTLWSLVRCFSLFLVVVFEL